jgi:hypothetical protein
VSYLLFMDESGHDLRVSPYEVLAGICLEDRDLWNFISSVKAAQEEFFGQRSAPGGLELKARKLLKTKVFRHAAQMPPLSAEDRRRFAQQCLEKGAAAAASEQPGGSTPSRVELTALAQAKIAFVGRLLELCASYRAHAFASIVDRDSPRPQGGFLRKDYAYLFERYFYFLEDRDALGLVVFDELERAQCHILLDQMGHYFRTTANGRMRASRVIPEPFFVHSDLTTAVQVADIVAYLVAWGVRVGSMDRPRREELADLAMQVIELRYSTTRDLGLGQSPRVWSFALIDDLRPREERPR